MVLNDSFFGIQEMKSISSTLNAIDSNRNEKFNETDDLHVENNEKFKKTNDKLKRLKVFSMHSIKSHKFH